MFSPVEKIPQLRPLILGIPLPEVIPVGEKTLLGACLLLITSATTQCRIEAILLDRIQQRRDLQAVPRRIRSFFFLNFTLVDRPLNRAHDKASPQLLHKSIPILESLREVMTGIDVHQREGQPGGPESLTGKVGHDDRVLSSREQERGIFKLARRFPQHEDGFRFKLVEVT